jgi:metal-sulfur cluster biosynthetic enzyme
VVSVKDQIIEKLKTVYDPEIDIDIWNLGLIYSITSEAEGQYKITMTLTSMWCPSAEEIPEWVRYVAEDVEGVDKVEVDVTFTPPWSPDLATDIGKLRMGYTE